MTYNDGWEFSGGPYRYYRILYSAKPSFTSEDKMKAYLVIQA